MTQPSAQEQYMLELINRARLNPQGEADLFGIGLNDGLTSGTITSDSKQPLAFNLLLIDSARSHSQWMLDTDTFSHTGIDGTSSNQRMRDAGYQFTGSWTSGENIGWQGTTGSFNETIYTADIHQNLFESPGHRKNILKADYREIGLGNITGQFTTSTGTTYNALMVTQNFAKSGSSVFLTGVAYDDLELDDDFYTVGEGLAGIDITAVNTSNGSSHTTTTMNAGGYQMALPGGTYNVYFSNTNGNLGNPTQITIASQNIKLDLNTDNLSLNFTYGSNNNDYLVGGIDHDILIGSAGSDTLIGDDGNDSLKGGADNDTLRGSAGQDTLNGGDGDDSIYGELNRDLLLGGLGNDLLAGEDGQDTLDGEAGNDTLYGDNDDDILNGGNGIDSLFGGDGNDSLDGGADNDLLNSGDGNDTLNGSDGEDRLFGMGGDDFLSGGSNNDLLNSGSGNDTLYGGAGNDTLYSGTGADTFALESGKGADAINDFADGIDFLGFTGSLSFSDLNIVDSGTDVVIYDLTNSNALLATIANINAGDLTPADFVTL